MKLDIIRAKSEEILLSSTILGLPNIFRTKNLFLKMMWLVSFLASSSVGIYTVVKTLNNFFSYEVVTKIDVINEIPASFPSLTFLINRNKMLGNYSLNSLILFCQFNEDPCNIETDFNIIVDKYGFTSYKFKNKSSYHVGSKYGLQLILNLTDIDCIDCEFDGIEVIIHDNKIDPMYYLGTTSNGFNIGIL